MENDTRPGGDPSDQLPGIIIHINKQSTPLKRVEFDTIFRHESQMGIAIGERWLLTINTEDCSMCCR